MSILEDLWYDYDGMLIVDESSAWSSEKMPKTLAFEEV